ncbi:DUF2637 domain-containing protein [Nonomuraea antri]|uniref:DUF2637 domain-containing protein n=1 Tax=Nonomuraea antri TaxID=2730852 RepID=UPI001F1D49F2|nr:DUF2637 domain-containing protein [Nonomuraea antri]
MITYDRRTEWLAYGTFLQVKAVIVAGLRSRVRRFESCRGHTEQGEHLPHCLGAVQRPDKERAVPLSKLFTGFLCGVVSATDPLWGSDPMALIIRHDLTPPPLGQASDPEPAKCSESLPAVSRSPEKWIWGVTTASVLLVALIAAVVSFRHMHELALQHGEDRLAAALIPLAVDGTIVAASMSLLLASRSGARGGVLPWTMLVLGSLASLGANIAVAEPSLIGRVIAGWPSFALIGAYEMLMTQIRRHAATKRRRPEGDLHPQGVDEELTDGHAGLHLAARRAGAAASGMAVGVFEANRDWSDADWPGHCAAVRAVASMGADGEESRTGG